MAEKIRGAQQPKGRTRATRSKKSSTAPPKFVVGLGASAGGLEALEQFFDHAPADKGAAYIVVMHLSRDFKSMLDGLLARHTSMPVKPAEDGMSLQGDTIYVIQPNTSLEVDRSSLKVDRRANISKEGVVAAVDTLFRSIAENWGERGAAVVLSGSGSDGAKGLRSVRQAGGFACAQSPETAKFDPMPIAAIATEDVNAVEAPEQLAKTVIDGLMMPMASRLSSKPTEDDSAMARIVDSVIGATTLKAEEYKHSTFARRVSRRMMNLRVNSLSDYSVLVADDQEEAQALCDDLLIGVTEFFRDDKPFKTIQNIVIPQIIQKAHEDGRPIRIWIAGCATGEEAYSIAILFREALRDMPFEIDVQIFASDISKRYLNVAAKGTYSSELTERIPSTLLERYFEKDETEDEWTVIKRVRRMVVFAPHDLLSDPPFTKLDLVCCRNVLIYFSVEAQQRILGGFAFGLNPGGFLFLGASETVGGQRELFDFVDGRQRIFSRSRNRVGSGALRKARDLFPTGLVRTPATRKTNRLRKTELLPAYSALLAEYAPGSILVSAERELLHTFGDAARFMRPPSGVANLDATELVDPALKTPLIVGLERSVKEGKPLTFTKVALADEANKGVLVDLTVRPLQEDDNEVVSYFLATIDDHRLPPAGEDAQVSSVNIEELVEGRHAELENELARTREALQSTIEEIETANEELQASNEELMSANEELQSTNEELSSVNEELYTVNAEYHRQNDELIRLNNDFDLLLNATQIGVLFLDEHGKISRFTGLAKSLFNFEESDIGRPVGNFSSPFQDFDVSEALADMQDPDAVVEFERVDKEGVPWLIRLVRDEASFGVVITFIDISELRDAETEVRQSHRMLEIMRKTAHAYFFECDPAFETVFRQVGYDEWIGEPDMQLPYTMGYDNVHPDDLAGLRDKVKNGMEAGVDGEYIYRMKSAQYDDYRYIRASAERLENGNWQIVATDIDEIYRADQKEREQAAILEATLSAGRSFKAYIKADRTIGFAKENWAALFGMTADEAAGKSIDEVIPKALLEGSQNNIDAVLAGQERDDVREVTLHDKKMLLSVRYMPVREQERVIGFVFDGIDISQLAEYADHLALLDQLLSSSVRNSSQGHMLVSPETCRVHYANNAARKLLGLKHGEFEEDKFNISRMTPEISETSWRETFALVVEKKVIALNDQVILTGANKEEQVDLLLESDSTRDDGGFIAVHVIENPEKQKMISSLRERSKKLASSNRDLEQFTSAVAHDLRAPLRHISSFSEILASAPKKMSRDEMAKNAQLVAGSAANLRRMVGGLLDYARIGLREEKMEPCDLVDVCNAAQQNLLEEIEAAGGTVEVTGEGSVVGNRELLVSLFQNLIGNSIKYRDGDKKPKIEIVIEPGKKGYSVTFSDNGIGIDPEFADKIFELFRRLHSEDEYAGLGIGLTTCRKIAELHQADISLDREHRDGARFILGPLQEAAQAG